MIQAAAHTQKHPPSPAQQISAFERAKRMGVSRWITILAIALPLVAIVIATWLGAAAVVAQHRKTDRALLRTRADTASFRIQAILRAKLDLLEAAAAHGTPQAAQLDALLPLHAYALVDVSHPSQPSLVRAQAVREALASGTSVRPGRGGDAQGEQPSSARLVLAASDHLADAKRVAIAETTPQALLEAGASSADGESHLHAERLLLDADFRPLQPLDEMPWKDVALRLLVQNGDAITVMETSQGQAILTVRAVGGFPLAVAMIQPRPGPMAILFSDAPVLLYGGIGCLVLVAGSFFMLGSLTHRRLLAAETQREMAYREMEHMQKLSSIGRLAAGVAHEINNPLAIIGEKAGLMKDLAGVAKDMPKAERFVTLSDAILHAVSRCRAITHRLLGFARRMEVRSVELQLNEVLRETLGFLEREAMHRQVTLDLQFDEELPAIHSDRGQLQQVFLNLLNNAMAAVADGGRIQVLTQKEADGVAVAIEDNGTGMSPEVLSHIFEPFFSTKGEQGTGLGLSITYGIIDKLGGHIDVASTEGEGTTFTITLPLHAPGHSLAGGVTEGFHG